MADSQRRLRLLDQIEWCCRRRHYSPRTAEAYVYWTRRFILFNRKVHPRELGADDVRAFLDSLVATRVAAATHSQALNAVVFLYREVLGTDFQWLAQLERPKRPQRLPTVLDPKQVARVLREMRGVARLMAELLYGTGMRIHECLELRVKDIQWANHAIVVRDGKGGKDRSTLLPRELQCRLRDQVREVAELHRRRLRLGSGWVPLPDRLAGKYPGAARSLAWQYVFPSSRDRWERTLSRWERAAVSASFLQREFRYAVRRAGVEQHATVHTLRHAFATHLLQSGVDIRTLQQLLGHAKLDTTMIYTHVGDIHRNVRSPLDALEAEMLRRRTPAPAQD